MFREATLSGCSHSDRVSLDPVTWFSTINEAESTFTALSDQVAK